MSKAWKIGIVIALVVAIGVVIASRPSREPVDEPAELQPSADAIAEVTPPEEASAGPSEATPESAEAAPEEATALPRFVEVGAASCVPCKMMQPVLDPRRSEYAGRLEVVMADVWKNPELGQLYEVRTIPTQVIYDSEGTEVFRHIGFWPKEEIEAKLQELGIID